MAPAIRTFLAALLLLSACAPGAREAGPASCEGAACANGCSVTNRICQGKQVFACDKGKAVGEPMQTCVYGDCQAGACTRPCDVAAEQKSYVGCEYWAVDLDTLQGQIPSFSQASCTGFLKWSTLKICSANGTFNDIECETNAECDTPAWTCMPRTICHNNAQYGTFGIVVSNPDKQRSVDVTLSLQNGMSKTIVIGPGAVQSLLPQALGFPDQSLNGTNVEPKAYRLVASHPVVAYQFNPMNNIDTASNDASLLLPSSTFTQRYTVLAPASGSTGSRGYFTVVASAPGKTVVTVMVNAAVKGSMTVPMLAAKERRSFTLSQYETLNLEGMTSADLTGSEVVSDKPVGVFVGHEQVLLGPPSAPRRCCADRLEEQLLPESSWGQRFAIARTPRRGDDPEYMRILALEDDTDLTIDPPPAMACPRLKAKETCDRFFDSDVMVTANKPILIARILVSSAPMTFLGDPSMSFAIPMELFRTSYDLLVPEAYTRSFFSVAIPRGGTIKLDGAPVPASALRPFGSNSMVAANLDAQAGQHRIECSLPCGVEGGGWSKQVSYLYPAGADIKPITIR